MSIVFWLLARYIAMVFICVVQCRVVEYLLISKDNDDQIVTVNIVAESAVQWLVQLPPALYSQNRIRVSADMQAMLDENVPTLPNSAVSLSTRGIQKNKSRHHHKQMFENSLSTCTWDASPQRPSMASRIFAN